MRKIICIFLACICMHLLPAQNTQRIFFNSVIDTITQQWTYESYFNDSINSLTNDTESGLFFYSNVVIELQGKSKIGSFNIYNTAKDFGNKVAYLFVINGNDTSFICSFKNNLPLGYISINMPYPIVATKVLIKKYGNNIPQKLKVFGEPYITNTTVDLTPLRLPVNSIAPAINTGMNYSPWLNDQLNSLVASVWSSNNMRYVDVQVKINSRAQVSKISLYDEAGTFTTNPCYIFIQKDTTLKLIATFQGLLYQQFVHYNLPEGIQADAIVIRKYGNNIPQKVQVFGRLLLADPTLPILPPIVQHTGQRVPLVAVNASINTGQQYANLLVENLDSIVAPDFSISNQQWTDLTFPFITTNKINKITLYNLDSITTPIQSTLYYKTDTGLVFITNYTTGAFNTLSSINLPDSPLAKAIVLRKFGNVFPQKIIVYGSQDTLPIVKIPIDVSRWFSTTYAPNGIASLFNGTINESINTGFASWKPQYEWIYPIDEGEMISLKRIKLYDFNGSFSTSPTYIFGIKKNGIKILLATFTGSKYMEWVGPYPDRNNATEEKFNLDSTITDIQYIVISCTNNQLPTEIEFIGNYTPPYATIISPVNTPYFSQSLGVNGFEWDFVNPFINSRMIDENKYAAIKNFTGFRHYLDWKRIENTKGWYTFSPCHNGGFSLDVTYERCKRDSIEVLACIKDIPDWMKATYPTNQQASDNIPLQFSFARDSVASYIEKGKVAFQFAARYGRNSQVPLSLLKVNTSPRWTADPPNTIKVGLDYVRYMECGNELDKWWKGLKGYMNCYEYAALLSAFYDGHKGTLGNDVGAKNADSTMLIVITGIANSNTAYVRGMIEWCKQNRGYLPNGKVNICWDVINYHHYSNDIATSQIGTSTRGAAPELGNVAEVAKSFVQFSQKYLQSMPVWVTELGFDVNTNSTQRAIPIGNKSILQTQADWTLRSALVNARVGINRLFFYELKDFDVNNAVKYASMGLCDSAFNKKPALNYLVQTNQLLGNYKFLQSLQNSPMVDVYENKGNQIFAVWSPTDNGITIPYTINLQQVDSAIIYTPQLIGNILKDSTVPVINGQVQVTVTETPIFITAKPAIIYQSRLAKKPIKNDKLPIFNCYPNPFKKQTQFTITAPINGKYTLEIFTLNGSKVATLFTGFLFKNKPSTFVFNNSQSTSNTYVYKFTGINQMITGKIIAIQ